MMQTESRSSITILRLNRSVRNPINGEMVDALEAAIHAAAADPAVAGVVLSTTSEKFFSIGLDIPDLFPLSREEFGRFIRNFDRLCLTLLAIPKPTVAAVRGHAVAGGCVLALCCDYRIIGSGKKLMGLNEAKLGVPVPYPAHQALVHAVGPNVARRMIDSASFYSPDELLRFGLVDQIAEDGDAEDAAASRATQLAEIPGCAYRAIKADRIGPMVDEVAARQIGRAHV